MTQHSIKPVLVVGATGTVGGAAVRALQAQGARVRVLLRPHTDARALGNVEVVRGCLQEGEAVARAIHGVSAALYVSPHDPERGGDRHALRSRV